MLETAGSLYTAGDLPKLERLFDVMREQIHNDEARGDLEKFEEKVEESSNEQLAAIDKTAQTRANVVQKKFDYDGVDSVYDWKLGEILKKHQQLARKYSLLPR